MTDHEPEAGPADFQGVRAMNAAGADEVSEILDRIKGWPQPRRITLARRILESLELSASGTGAEPSTDATRARRVGRRTAHDRKQTAG